MVDCKNFRFSSYTGYYKLRHSFNKLVVFLKLFKIVAAFRHTSCKCKILVRSISLIVYNFRQTDR